MKKITIILVALFQLGLVYTTKAQVDPHFSQYYAYPLWLNPALTGVMDGDLRVNANFKNQWPGIGNAYNTGGLSIDYRATDKVSVGFNLIDQAAGNAGYNYLGAYGSFAYGVQVTEDQWINFGVQAGFINRSFDVNKFQLGSQFNPVTGFDPTLPGNENFLTSSAMVFDASAGVYFHDDDPLKDVHFFGGVSLAHLARSKDPFALPGIDSKLPIRYNIHAGLLIKASDYFNVTPHAIYIRQHNNQIKALGVNGEFKLQGDNSLILGGMYRLQDAAVANVGYHLTNMVIGVSYDFNTSALNTASNGNGGFELSVSYVFHKGIHGREPVCPRF